jgi:hypothetical protein
MIDMSHSSFFGTALPAPRKQETVRRANIANCRQTPAVSPSNETGIIILTERDGTRRMGMVQLLPAADGTTELWF